MRKFLETLIYCTNWFPNVLQQRFSLICDVGTRAVRSITDVAHHEFSCRGRLFSAIGLFSLVSLRLVPLSLLDVAIVLIMRVDMRLLGRHSVCSTVGASNFVRPGGCRDKTRLKGVNFVERYTWAL